MYTNIIKWIKWKIGDALKAALRKAGYESYIVPGNYKVSDGICINIGAGNWNCPGWINLDYPSEWYDSVQKRNSFLPYDIRSDDLPFDNDSVDCIYCSHVIEHIETKYVEKMFTECYRVLKIGGCVRLSCPDAEFLYQMDKFGKSYWGWILKFLPSSYDFKYIRSLDLLIHEIATSKFGMIDGAKEFHEMKMYDFLEWLTQDLSYDKGNVANHINYWTFQKIERLAVSVGFSNIIRSHYQGCVRPEMQSIEYFDKTEPQMSLYTDLCKM